MMNFDDFPSMERSLLTTAAVVGTPQARQRAEAYNRYLNQQISMISQKTSGLSQQQRPTVLHIQSLKPLKVDGRNTLIDTWIKLAGGRNVAASVDGNMKQITPEQVLAWQPDYIILDASAGTLEQSPYQAIFSQLRAVKQHHVVRNPSGFSPGIVTEPKLLCKFNGQPGYCTLHYSLGWIWFVRPVISIRNFSTIH